VNDPLPERCLLCGGGSLRLVPVLPEDLVTRWGLADDEVDYVNLQQGYHCVDCGSTLRCMALAAALLRLYRAPPPFSRFVDSAQARSLRVLEINAAGGLSPFFARLPLRTLAAFPEIDMRSLPWNEASFDLVVHSDTLEHVPSPVAGLRECRRVLVDGGACALTVPMVVGRLTRSRAGLPETFHGAPNEVHHHLVHTEYGADAWRQVLEAGFAECRLSSLAAPAAHALIGIR
jgi:SAM-dependent methyltransferase